MDVFVKNSDITECHPILGDSNMADISPTMHHVNLGIRLDQAGIPTDFMFISSMLNIGEFDGLTLTFPEERFYGNS